MVSSTLSLAWPRTGPMVASRRRRISLPRLDSFMVRGGVAGGVALAGPPPGSTAWAPSPSPLCDTLLTSCSGFYIRGSKCPNKTVRLNKLHLLGRSDMKAHRCPQMRRVLADCVNCWSPHGDRRCPSCDQQTRVLLCQQCDLCWCCPHPGS